MDTEYSKFVNTTFGICVKYSGRYSVHYRVHCSVEGSVQGCVKCSVDYTVNYNLKEAGKRLLLREKVSLTNHIDVYTVTVLYSIAYTLQYSVHFIC